MAKTVTLPGVADTAVRDSGWRQDSPAHWEQYQQGESVRAGKGRRWRVTLSDEAAADLREYLESKQQALACMTPMERGADGGTELRALTAALARW